MEKEFVPYTEALELKKLGFNEPCFGFYDDIDDDHPVSFIRIESLCDKLKSSITLAPLYQQAFRWFRETYELHSFIDCKWKNLGWEFQLVDLSKMETISSIDRYNYKTDKEAELECLKKLIEIVKEKQL
jgi:hypothetical protein